MSEPEPERAVDRADVDTERVRVALGSRLIVEQATGVLAQRGGLTLHTAFDRLRHYSRHHDVPLSQVAHEVVETNLIADDVLATLGERAQAGRAMRTDRRT